VEAQLGRPIIAFIFHYMQAAQATGSGLSVTAGQKTKRPDPANAEPGRLPNFFERIE